MKVNLLKDNIGRMFFTLMASAIGSTLVTTIYSTVDMICVGHYCKDAGTAAISVINPLWSLMIAFGILGGVGGAVMMANRRGASDERAANEYFTLGTVFSLFWALLIGVLLFTVREPLLTLFGASSGSETMNLALEYLSPICFVAPTFTMCACLSTFMRTDGETLIPTVATVAGGVCNIFLDIFLVFDFGAGLGMFGAGLATAIGQFISFVIIISYFFTKKCSLKLVMPKKILRKLRRIICVGIAAFIIEMSYGILITVFNNLITLHLTKTHLAVFGTASSLLVMCYGILNGVGTALQPIASSNNGAGQRQRVSKALKIGLVSATALSVLFFALIQLFPEFILKIYMDTTENPEILRAGPEIVRIYCSALAPTGVTIVCTYYFQSILKAELSAALSVLRGLLLPVCFALLLPALFSQNYSLLWWSVPISELIVFAVSVIALLLTERKRKKTAQLSDTPHAL